MNKTESGEVITAQHIQDFLAHLELPRMGTHTIQKEFAKLGFSSEGKFDPVRCLISEPEM